MLEQEILNLIKSDPSFPKYERLYNYKKNSGSKAEAEKIVIEALNSTIDSRYKPDLTINNN